MSSKIKIEADENVKECSISLDSCRICLNSISNCKGIFLENVIEKLENCFSIKILINDNLPQMICENCLNKLNDCNIFKSLIINNEEKLFIFLQNSIIKNELVNETKENINEKRIQAEDKNEQSNWIDCNNFVSLELNDKSKKNQKKKSIDDINDEADYAKCIYSFGEKEVVFVKNYTEIITLEQVKNELDEDIQINNKLLESSEIIEVSDRFIHIVFLNFDNERSVDEDFSNFRCNMCGALHLTSLALKKHAQKLHFGRNDEVLFNNNPDPYRCRICGQSFEKPIQIKAHRIKHKLAPLDKKYEAQCYLCYKFFLDGGKFYNHLAVHEGRFPIKCQFCDQKLHYASMPSHLKMSHTHVQQLETCQLCQRKVRDLKKHKEKVHTNKIYNCVECSRIFNCASGLNLHQLKIHGIQVVKQNKDDERLCTICGKTLSRTNYKIHIALHQNEKNHLCVECGRYYQTKLLLDRHTRHTHMREYLFQCTQCDKKFKKNCFLTLHIKNRHENFRPFKCDICEKAFFTRKILNDHLNIHSGLRPYACQICNETFSFKAALFTHNKLKHLKIKANLARKKKEMNYLSS